MLREIFKALLITSLAGSCLTAVIALSKPITKKVFGYSWHYYIWLAVLAVMILPVRFTLPQKTDIPPITAMQTVQTEQTVQAVQNTDNIVSDVQTEPKTDIWQAGTSLIKRVIDNRLNILALLWLIGTAVLLLINLIGYIRLIIKMRKNSVVVSCPELMNFTDKRVTVRVWENTSSPFMTGIFKPTLVLPARELTEEQLNNILRHEMTHFKRHDILYKWFVSLVKCVHWFNPVIWYVAKQINTECEISCDMAVTQNMNRNEEMSYIDTVLSLLPMGKTRQIPLTTQMASSKKILKRRFTMIRNKKKTNKIMSALSAVIALVMLGTTVFASGVLSDMTTDDYTVEIINNGEKIEFANKPFIENGEVYVPLRELFEKVGVMEHPDSRIEWNNGKIDLCIAFYADAVVTSEHQSLNNGQGVDIVTFIANHAIEIGKSSILANTVPNLAGQDISREIAMDSAPILKGSNTYISYSYVRRILDTQKWNIGYAVYDKDENPVDFSGFYHQVIGEYSIKIPDSWGGKYTVKTSENGDMLSFIQKATYDKYGEGSGTLFRIEKVSTDGAEEILNMLGGSKLLYSNDEYAYIFEIPTDVQYPIWADSDEEDVEIAAEYERMFKDVEFIADSFSLTEKQ